MNIKKIICLCTFLFLIFPTNVFAGKGVSSKTHTQQQCDYHANQKNPNNPAYKAAKINHDNQTMSSTSSKSFCTVM